MSKIIYLEEVRKKRKKTLGNPLVRDVIDFGHYAERKRAKEIKDYAKRVCDDFLDFDKPFFQ
jgi:hypothetical protein|tara:strand:- start:5076 stop:5261 length:186 start_codon:yes stop_codon:yes gene_type:complete